MTQNQYNQLKISKVCSLEAFNWLSEWIKAQHPNNPYPPGVKDYFYRNSQHRQYLSKFLENVISKVLRSKGCDPIKAKDAGKFIDKTKVVTDTVGFSRTIGSGNWVKDANVHKGRADIKCFYNGQMWNYEVKVGKDKMSEDQHQEQQRAEANGEMYVIIKTVDDFLRTL